MKIQFSYQSGVYKSATNNLVYIPILKNAHMWAKKVFDINFGCNQHALRGNSGTFFNENRNSDLEFKDSIYLVILRDPIVRWISATAQYLIKYPNIDLDDPVIRELLSDGVIFDAHATPQHLYLMDISINRCVFFMCDDNLENNINLFSELWFDRPSFSVEPMNMHFQNPEKSTIYPKLKFILNNDKKLQDRLKSMYTADYVLLDAVKNKFIDSKNATQYLIKLKSSLESYHD